jgi:hypothetical protein
MSATDYHYDCEFCVDDGKTETFQVEDNSWCCKVCEPFVKECENCSRCLHSTGDEMIYLIDAWRDEFWFCRNRCVKEWKKEHGIVLWVPKTK